MFPQLLFLIFQTEILIPNSKCNVSGGTRILREGEGANNIWAIHTKTHEIKKKIVCGDGGVDPSEKVQHQRI